MSIHWGARRKAGRFTGQECVVVSLEGKAPRHHLRAGQRFPSFLEVETRRGVAKVRVDVQGAGGQGRLLVGVRPGAGFRIRALGNEIAFGTLSGVQEQNGQPSGVLLSGHVAEREGRALEVRAFGRVYDLGSVSKIVPVVDGDIALGEPLPAGAEELGLAQLADLRDQAALHIHMLVKVLTWREPNGLQTHITARERNARFRHQGTDVTVRSLIGLHGVASDGDSGAPVVDLRGNLLGFVVGEYSGETMVMPARRALDALRAAR